MHIWILNSALPDGNTVRPISYLEIFTNDAEARAAFDKAMREEWEHNAPRDDADEPLPYPDDPDKAHDAIVADKAYGDVDEPWGQWTLTRHDLPENKPPSPAQSSEAMALLRELVAWEGEAFDDDEEIDGGDVVEFLAEFRLRAKALIGGEG